MIVAEGHARQARDWEKQELQWGRNMIVAEGGTPKYTFIERTFASMGPQHDSCGRVAYRELILGLPLVLQWGRNMIVAEGGSGRSPALGLLGFNGAAT